MIKIVGEQIPSLFTLAILSIFKNNLYDTIEIPPTIKHFVDKIGFFHGAELLITSEKLLIIT